jgi:hypothetical protein
LSGDKIPDVLRVNVYIGATTVVQLTVEQFTVVQFAVTNEHVLIYALVILALAQLIFVAFTRVNDAVPTFNTNNEQLVLLMLDALKFTMEAVLQHNNLRDAFVIQQLSIHAL